MHAGAPDAEGNGEPARYVSLVNAGRVLGGLTTREIRNMIDRGELEGHHFGRRHMILVESIDALVNRKKAEALAARELVAA